MVPVINVKGILNKVVDIEMKGKELPRGILTDINSDKDNNSDVDQVCLDIEQFEIIKTVGKGE